MPNNDELLGRLEGLLTGLEKSLNQFNKELYGNGQPGIVKRVTLTESAIREVCQDIENLSTELAKAKLEEVTTLKTIAQDIVVLKTLVREHTEDKTKHTLKGLLLTGSVIRKAIVGTVLSFIALHSLFGGFTLDDVIKWVMRLFGLNM